MEIITPTDREHWLALRQHDITSTDVAALFNISPYLTIYELWHRKNKSIAISIEETERMYFGSLLEPVIAQEAAKRNGWTVTPMKDYYRLPEHRIGSSFDYAIGDDGICECKNVDARVYSESWTETEAPLHIEIQVQHQLAVSDRKFAYIVALVGGNELKIIRRERDERVIQAIKDKVRWFWSTIESGKEPEPDFSKDAEFITRLYGYAEPEKVIEAGDNIKTLAEEYKRISDEIKPLEEKKEALKAQILTIIDDAEKIIGDGFTISAGMVGECPINYIRKAYRSFKINWKKAKEKK